MKRFVLFILFVIICYSSFSDLTKGSLNYLTSDSKNEAIVTTADSSYFEYTVKNGDTLITIIEKQLNQSIPVSIDTLILDFKELNNNLEPTYIQAGKSYRFPNYKRNDV